MSNSWQFMFKKNINPQNVTPKMKTIITTILSLLGLLGVAALMA